MSTQQGDLKGKLAKRAQNGAGEQKETFAGLIAQVNVKRRFEEILGQRAPGFMSSVLAVVNNNRMLREADPKTVLTAAAIAASLDLPIDPNLGFAAIVPYRDNRANTVKAQFQMQYKGFVQLAMRTGQYRLMNVAEVYEGEIKRVDRITGEIEFDYESRTSDKIIGYAAYFRLLNGFEHTEYMTLEEIHAHARRFSKSYGDKYGPWSTNTPMMERKTVLKRLVSRWGIMSVQMQTAVLADQAVITEGSDGPEYDYVDGTTVEDGAAQETPGAQSEVQSEVQAESAATSEKTQEEIDREFFGGSAPERDPA